jgi:ParB/RepB/Spo0J family partition protein
MTTQVQEAPVAVPEGCELRFVDPDTLVNNPANQRTDKERTAWAKSIAALGVLEPLLAYERDDGALALIAGECRKYSAIAAKLTSVPVYVRNDMTEAMRLAGVIGENRNREGLRPVVEARIIQQMFDLPGMTEQEVSALTGIKRPEIREARRVVGSEAAMAIAERHSLTMFRGAVLAEFEDTREALKLLTVTAVKRPEDWDHKVANLRRERAEREAREAVALTITESGAALVDENEAPVSSLWLDELPAPKRRKSFTEAAHRACPGHFGAVVEDYDSRTYVAIYGCLDPVEHGHLTTLSEAQPAAEPPADVPPRGMSDEAKAALARTKRNNKEWVTATAVRLRYVAQLLTGKKVPKGTLRFVAEVVILHPTTMGNAYEFYLARVLGKGDESFAPSGRAAVALIENTADPQLPLALLAQVAASVEGTDDRKDGWRRHGTCLIPYLDFLATTGYALSRVEREVMGLPAEDELADLELAEAA